ncbi:MAG: hypothetical protein DDT34_01163 [Firmicutes bacterium]|nr:hypothetical protein [Bacillota bacterium]
MWAVAQLKERPAIFGVYAINTDLGKPSGTPEYREIVTAEIARRVEAHTGEGFDLVIFPESILHDVSAVDEVMLMPVTSAKGRPDVWVGATSRRSDGLFDNAIIALDAGLPAVGFSRLPVPIGNWRPLVGGGVYPRPFESDIVEWRGHMIALSVCYEDGVLWGHPGLLSGQADLLVSVANLWALEGTRTAHAQSVGAGALARLGGVSMRRAVNE